MKNIKRHITHSLCIMLASVLFSCSPLAVDTDYTHRMDIKLLVDSKCIKGYVLSQNKSIISRKYFNEDGEKFISLPKNTIIVSTSNWYAR